MKRIFICSPYRGDIQANTARALELCRFVLRAGHAPFAPHLFYPQMLDDGDQEQRAAGIAAGMAWLDACDAVLRAGPISEGMYHELKHAERVGKRVITGIGRDDLEAIP